ncbi:MAG: DUF488 family protein [Rhodospirillaceae bacterium]
MFQAKRVYEPAAAKDGYRVLIDRLWPRGVSKDAAAVDLWLKEIAPSTELRKWFGHDAARWEGFADRYREELKTADPAAALETLRAAGRKHAVVTLLFATKEFEQSHAVLLLTALEAR